MSAVLTPAVLTGHYARLMAHDWYFHYSDSREAWQAGADEEASLFIAQRDQPLLAELYGAFIDARWSGPAFGTEQRPTPVLRDWLALLTGWLPDGVELSPDPEQVPGQLRIAA